MRTYKIHFVEKESDITIISESKSAILRAKEALYFHRAALEIYIQKNKEFLTTFSPIHVKSDSEVVNLMAEAAFLCDVGPMAAVAGALADLMLKVMKSKEVHNFTPARVGVVENGGEIAIDSEQPIKIALFAGYNDLNLNLGFLIDKIDCPLGIATSSATFGHAISFGQADSVTIFANTAAIADGAATKICNLVKGQDIEASIKKGLDSVDKMSEIRGAFITRDNKVGYTGKIPQIFKIEGDTNKILKDKISNLFPGDYEIY